MEAAAAGILITRLEVMAKSTSDARGLLGLKDDRGEAVTPAPSEVELVVRIGTAADVAGKRLLALIDASSRCSPVSAALERAIPVRLHVDIETN
jgi:hypothetical protein